STNGSVCLGMRGGLRLNARANASFDRLRRNTMRFVIRLLYLATPFRLLDRALNRVGHLVCVKNDLRINMPCRSADRLHKRRLAAQKTFLVCVQDADHRDFGQIEPFSQKIDTDERFEMPST